MTCKIVPEMTYNVSSEALSLYTTYVSQLRNSQNVESVSLVIATE